MLYSFLSVAVLSVPVSLYSVSSVSVALLPLKFKTQEVKTNNAQQTKTTPIVWFILP